jgi:hypothetical protein
MRKAKFTRRTCIVFSEVTFEKLISLSEQHETSVGETIRNLIEKALTLKKE